MRTSHCQRLRFHWCSEPEEETGLGCLQAPLAVATGEHVREGQHVEKNLESLASCVKVQIYWKSQSLIKGRQDMEEVFEDCHDVEVVYQRCCGLDIHKKMIVACLIIVAADGKRRKQIRTFGTTTAAFLELLDWLKAAGCTHIGMEHAYRHGGDRRVLETNL
jgi:hypothetical protein